MNELNRKTKICPNCQENFDSSCNYCPNCGQSNRDLKLNFRYFVSEFLVGLFNIDSKIFKTLRLLFFKPGKLSKEFIAGKRNSYIQPVRLYLIGSLIYFTIASFFSNPVEFTATSNNKPNSTSNIVTLNNLDSLQALFSISDTALKKQDSGDSLLIESFSSNKIRKLTTQEGRKEFKKNLISFIPIGMFIFVPLTALLLFMFFRRKSFYMEHLIFVIHLQTLFYILFTILNLLELIISESVIDPINSILFFGIILIWIKKYYEVGWWTTFWKTTLFLMSYAIVFLIFFVALSAISIYQL